MTRCASICQITRPTNHPPPLTLALNPRLTLAQRFHAPPHRADQWDVLARGKTITAIPATRLPNRVEGEVPGVIARLSIGGFLLQNGSQRRIGNRNYTASGMPEA